MSSAEASHHKRHLEAAERLTFPSFVEILKASTDLEDLRRRLQKEVNKNAKQVSATN